MSIQITVRSSNGTTHNKTINGDGPIDTKTEAEDALAFAANDGDTVQVGNDTYTRQQLIEIRDRKASGSSKAQAEKTFDFSMSGGPRMGKWGHSTGDLQATYGTLVKDGEKADVWAKIGGKIGGGLWNFETPGGEDATSIFGTLGLTGGVGLDINPKGGKAHIGLGVEGSVSGFTSPKSTIVSLPPTCTPDDFGQGECEPNAGPLTGDAGLTGVYNPDAHNSVHGAGVVVSGALKAGVGFDVSENTRLNLSVSPTVTYLADRHPFGFAGVNVGGGVTYLFGKVAGPTPPPSNPNATDDGQKVDQTGTPLNAGTVFDLSALIEGLPKGAQVSRIEMTNDATGAVEHKTDKAPWTVPADKMTAGDHTIRIYYTLPGGAGEKYRDVKIRVGAVQQVDQNGTITGTGVFSGIQLPQGWPTVGRPQAPAAGIMASPMINLGKVTPATTVPAGATIKIRVGDKTVRENVPVRANEAVDLTLTAYANVNNAWVANEWATDGTHDRVQIIMVDAKGKELGSLGWPSYSVTPPIATLTSASVIIPKNAKGQDTFYLSDPLKVKFTTNLATEHKVKVKVAGEEFTVTVPAGAMAANTTTREVTLEVSGKAPKTYKEINVKTVKGGVTQNKPVEIIPLAADGSAGVSVQAGNAPIRKTAGGGGGTGGGTTIKVPGT